MVGEKEILASLVEFKHHSMAETIRNKKEEKKTKAEAPGSTKKDKKYQTSNPNISVTAAVTEIISLKHLEWFHLASDVPNQRA